MTQPASAAPPAPSLPRHPGGPEPLQGGGQAWHRLRHDPQPQGPGRQVCACVRRGGSRPPGGGHEKNPVSWHAPCRLARGAHPASHPTPPAPHARQQGGPSTAAERPPVPPITTHFRVQRMHLALDHAALPSTQRGRCGRGQRCAQGRIKREAPFGAGLRAHPVSPAAQTRPTGTRGTTSRPTSSTPVSLHLSSTQGRARACRRPAHVAPCPHPQAPLTPAPPHMPRPAPRGV
jgi:hypothetical protein